MQFTIAAILPVMAMLIPLFVGVLGLKLYLRWEQKKPVRRPFTQEFMRLPGQSLRDKIESTREDFDTNLLLLIFMPLIIFSVHASQSYYGSVPETIHRIGFSAIIIIAIVIYFLRKIILNRKDLAALQLGLDGEIATAQLLDPLKRDGFYIYHDFQAKGFNIDHILVGPSGVFAVEAKARSKPDRGDNTVDSKVIFDGKHLIFPSHKESKPIEQTRRQAKWLSKWLSSAVGEQVIVSPLLVVPGWFIDIQAKPVGFYLTNGTNVDFLLRVNGNARLSDKKIKQITHQLEQKNCAEKD